MFCRCGRLDLFREFLFCDMTLRCVLIFVCRVNGHSWFVRKLFGVRVYMKDLKSS